jgi:CubicO group peptidase (beta-lactamase class C family)
MRASVGCGFTVVAVSICVVGCAGGAGGPEGPDPWTIEDPRVEQVLNGLLPPTRVAGAPGWNIEERMEHWQVPGLGIAVIHDFDVAWARALGTADKEERTPVTSETLFQAGSISKPVAAAGALRLVEQGRLDLGRPINEALQDWKLPDNEHTAAAPVTLRGLLSHTAGTTVHGFPGYAEGAALPTLQQVLDGTPPANTAPVRVDTVPGTLQRYSGGGTTIVQQAMIDVAGQPFPGLLRELVLDPVGMSGSSYEQPLPPERLALAGAGHRRNGFIVPGKRHLYPEMAAAGLWTTAAELARFAVAIQRSVRGDDGALLSQETATEMLTPVLDSAGLGFFIEEKRGEVFFSHGGADEGFQAYLIASRDHGYGAVVTTNSDNGINLAAEILRGIADVYEWQGYLDDSVERFEVDMLELDAYAGRYIDDGDDLVAVAPDIDELLVRRPLTERVSRLLPVGEREFLSLDSGTRWTFELGADGLAATVSRRSASGEEAGPVLRRTRQEFHPIDFLATGRTKEAISLLREAPDEARINRLGYRMLFNHRTRQAIAVFQLNTRLFPDSANAWDSLADGHLANGDRERADEAFRRLLEAAEGDGGTESEALRALVDRARAQLEATE